MAGIGFKLQRPSPDDGGSRRGPSNADYAFNAIGPWIVSAAGAALAFLVVSGFSGASESERRLVFVTVSNCFFFAPIVSGGCQLALASFIAVRLSGGEPGRIAPAFVFAERLFAIASLIAACLYFSGSPLSFEYKLIATLLFVFIGFAALSASVLVSVVPFRTLASAFVFGALAGWACMALLDIIPLPFGANRSATNLLAGFAAGAGAALAALRVMLVRSLSFNRKGLRIRILPDDGSSRPLFAVGALFQLGVRIDEIVAWFGKSRMSVEGAFPYNPVGDSALTLAGLTLLPPFLLLAAAAEKRFSGLYKQFYAAIRNGETLAAVESAKSRMAEALRRDLLRLILILGGITLALILASPYLPSLPHRNGSLAGLARIDALQVTTSSFVLLCILLMLHLEDRKGALIASSLFASGNTLIAACAHPFGFDACGWSGLIAPSATLVWSGCRLLADLRRLEMVTIYSAELRISGKKSE